MNIYKKTNHRQIYQRHYGSIPKDIEGRSYEIHHIDGNPLNNDIANLCAVSINEHFDIHYSRSDWIACFRIAKRIKISSIEKSDLARKAALVRVKNGTHNFLGDRNPTNVRAVAGTHHMIDHTIYCFSHKVTGEIVHMTQRQFTKQYSLNKGNVSSMIKSPERTVKKWSYLGKSE